jgi:putative ABC transport system ATP-binding protein
LIRAENIIKTYNAGRDDEVRALRDVSLEIAKGEFVIIIGANGSGKSTFFNMLQGAEKPTAGKVSINETDVTSMPEHKRSRFISRVFQNPGYGTAPELTICENFRLAAVRAHSKQIRIGNTSSFKNQLALKIEALGMGLEKKLDRPIGSLSGGQRQALTLLMSVMDDTSLLLMDEPTAALDPRSSKTIMSMAEKMNMESGLTILLVTHNLKDALQYGNRLIQFSEGRIIRDIRDEEKKKLTLSDLLTLFE